MKMLIKSQKREPRGFMSNRQVCESFYKRYGGYKNVVRIRFEGNSKMLQIEFDQHLMGLFELGKIDNYALAHYIMLSVERSDNHWH